MKKLFVHISFLLTSTLLYSKNLFAAELEEVILFTAFNAPITLYIITVLLVLIIIFSVLGIRQNNREKLVHQLFENHGSVMLLLDTKKRIIRDVNKAACQFFGYSRFQLIDMAISKVLSSVPHHNICESTAFLANGRHRTVAIQASSLTPNDHVVLLAIIQDITESKLEHLRNDLLIAALNSVASGIVITDNQSYIEWVNPAFTKLTGYTAKEAIGRRPADLVKSGVQNSDFYKTMWNTIGGGDIWQGELVNRHKDGSLFNEELTIAPVYNANGDITHFVGIEQDITERKRLQEELQRLATTDSLTQLSNRRVFMSSLDKEFSRQQRNQIISSALIIIDLDNFKQINDNYGHSIGDQVLQHFAAAVRRTVRSIDIAGRIGGEEFAILLPDANQDDAKKFMSRLNNAILDTPIQSQYQPVCYTISAGITLLKETDTTSENPFTRADNALYQAKNLGRDRIEIL